MVVSAKFLSCIDIRDFELPKSNRYVPRNDYSMCFPIERLEHVFCTETRPYNQGARLTAYELAYEKIPSTLIVDSAVSLVMKKQNLSAVIVGADRVVANGDTANKIGTYQLAIAG